MQRARRSPSRPTRAGTLSCLAWLFFLTGGAAATPSQLSAPPGGDADRSRPGPAGEGGGLISVGQSAPDGTPRAPVRPVATPGRAANPPTIDGRLDDLVWGQSEPIKDFVQRSPVEGAPASESTEVFLAYDSTHLYVAFYVRYGNPALIRANRSDRDRIMQDDTMSVYFDTFNDRQRAYVFSVNGYGVQADSMLRGAFDRGPGSDGPIGDASWDTLFLSAGTFVADGWTAELAIPFKSIRYPPQRDGNAHVWGFQISRTIQSKDEEVVWAPVLRGVASFMAQMGTFQGMTNVSTSRNLELLPTFTAIQLGRLDTATGVFVNDEVAPEGGLNVKYGVTSNLTFDFTYNPDFSQVESDRPQIEVNQRFPLFFPELRPFFLEGEEAFSTRGPINLVHTRTIIDPRYGAKLTGKVGKSTIGLLVANDEAPGKRDVTDPAFGATAQFTIGRFRYDLYPESYIGVLFTDRELLDAYNRVGGVDGWFRLGSTKVFDFRYMQSATREEDGSEHTGPTFNTRFAHTGRNLNYSLFYDHVDPGFDTETGFVRRVDTRRLSATTGYRWWPEHWLISWGPRVMVGRNYDFDGVLQDQNVNGSVNFQFARNVNVFANVSRDMERFLGVDFWKTGSSFNVNVSTNRAFSIGGGLDGGDEVRFSQNPFLGRSLQGRLFLTVRPVSRFQSNLQLNTSRLVDPATDATVFDVKLVRTLTTFQFTDRLLVRSINEYNTFDRKLGVNLLFTYRVNSGTVFYAGYDDQLRQGNLIDELRFPWVRLTRTRRAFFTKLQYLFRS